MLSFTIDESMSCENGHHSMYTIQLFEMKNDFFVKKLNYFKFITR